MNYKSYMLHNFRSIPQVQNLPNALIEAIDIVGSVLPFKTNNYVVENLINWDNVPDDPIFVLTFPQKGMLRPRHYQQIERLIKQGASKSEIKIAADEIRIELNPHPAGQLEHNVPFMDGEKTLRNAAQVQRNCFVFPRPGANMSCLLHFLFSLASVCWNG